MAQEAVVISQGRRVKGLREEGATAFVLICDAVLGEEYGFRSEITDNPLEDGAAVNDHILVKPDEITLRGVVSQALMTPLEGANSSAEVHYGDQVAKVSLSRPYDSNEKDRAQEAFDTLDRLHKFKVLLTVVLGYKIYYDMAISRVSISKQALGGKVLRFDASFKPIMKVATGVTAAVPTAAMAEAAAQAVNMGMAVGVEIS